MKTLLLSVLPMVSLLAVFVYAAVTGARMNRARGLLSALGIAVALLGFTIGRFVDRFVPVPDSVDDWSNYRNEAANTALTVGDRILAVLSVEVALMFLLASAMGALAVAIIKRDAALASTTPRPGGFELLGGIFVLAVAMTARAKLAVIVAFLMAKGHLL